MQFRELSSSELDEGFSLLSTLRLEITPEHYAEYLNAHSPHSYRPIGAFEKGALAIYAGISIHENLELGRYLIIDDFAVRTEYERFSREMIDYLSDYAKMYKCESIVLWGKQRGISIDDLVGFRPKRDGFIKTL